MKQTRQQVCKRQQSVHHSPFIESPLSLSRNRFNIAPDKYKEKHAITLFITSTSGSKAEVTLTNKKVPAKIEE